ncbi:MAG: hypothetical protein ACRETQ_08715 [Gammaproteobacteria bacterium]
MTMHKTLLGLAIALVSAVTWMSVQAATEAPPVPEVKLGSVTVRGQAVIQVLQALKLALQQPNSDNPKLADIIVCRIHNAVGSHVQQVLTCATNRTINSRRDQTELAWDMPTPVPRGPNGLPSNADTIALSYRIDSLNDVLDNQPGQVLNLYLNGTPILSLLAKTRVPAPARTTVRVAAAAPALVTGQGQNEVMQLGGIEVSGDTSIATVLGTIKSALQEPYSSSSQAAEVVVCRLNAESNDPSHELLTCATNHVWSTSQGSLRAIMSGAEVPAAPACPAGSGQAGAPTPLNGVLDELPGDYLQASVDNQQLHELLGTVPNACGTPATVNH